MMELCAYVYASSCIVLIFFVVCAAHNDRRGEDLMDETAQSCKVAG